MRCLRHCITWRYTNGRSHWEIRGLLGGVWCNSWLVSCSVYHCQKMNVARFESHQPKLAHTMIHCCFKTLLFILSDLSHILPSRSALRLTWQKKKKKYSSLLEEREVCSAAGSTSWNLRVLIKIDWLIEWLSEFFPYSPVFSCVFSQTVLPGVQAQW